MTVKSTYSLFIYIFLAFFFSLKNFHRIQGCCCCCFFPVDSIQFQSPIFFSVPRESLVCLSLCPSFNFCLLLPDNVPDFQGTNTQIILFIFYPFKLLISVTPNKTVFFYKYHLIISLLFFTGCCSFIISSSLLHDLHLLISLVLNCSFNLSHKLFWED